MKWNIPQGENNDKILKLKEKTEVKIILSIKTTAYAIKTFN